MKYYVYQNFRAWSKVLNATTGGEGDVTFSAWSYHLQVNKQSVWGTWRVNIIDRMFGAGHCARSYEWHAARDLISKDYWTG